MKLGGGRAVFWSAVAGVRLKAVGLLVGEAERIDAGVDQAEARATAAAAGDVGSAMPVLLLVAAGLILIAVGLSS